MCPSRCWRTPGNSSGSPSGIWEAFFGAIHATILHLHFTGPLGPYPWLARLCSVERVFFTHHASLPAGHVVARAAWWKRALARAINWPLSGVICVSNYGYRSVVEHDLLPTHRVKRIYNGVDLERTAPPDAAKAFRRKYSIPERRSLVSQVSWIIPQKAFRTCWGRRGR